VVVGDCAVVDWIIVGVVVLCVAGVGWQVMRWEFYGLIVAVVVLLFAIFAKYRGGTEWFTARVRKRAITFGTPHRVELILIALYFIFGLWWDIVMNKILDNGVTARVEWFAGVTTSALNTAFVLLVIFHIVLVTLFLHSLSRKKTDKVYDLIVGTAALFAVAILLSGFFAQLHNFNVSLFGLVLNPVSYYHIGIVVGAAAGLYWAFTD